MADIRTLTVEGTTYNIKDATARGDITTLQTNVTQLQENTADLPQIRENVTQLQENTADLPQIRENVENNSDDIRDLKSAIAKNTIYDSASGAIASFPDGADDEPIKQLIVNVDPVQAGSGDPSPDNVRPITGWTQAKVTRAGKNLLSDVLANTAYYEKDSDGAIININVSFGWTYENSALRCTLPAGQYMLYCIAKTATGSSGNVQIYSETKLILKMNNSNMPAGSVIMNNFSLDATKNIGVVCKNSGGYCWFVICKQSETEITEYIPYRGNTYDITFPTEAGIVYGGSLDAMSGTLTVNMAEVDLGTLSWHKIDTTGSHWRFWTYFNDMLYNGVMLSSQYKHITATQSYNGKIGIASQVTGSNNLVMVTDERFSDSATFKTAMSGVQFVYELSTPITYTLTPTEIHTLLGQNNIWSDTGDVEVTYPANLKLYIDKKVAQ